MSNTNTTAGGQTRWEDAAMKLSHQVMEQTEKLQAVEAQRNELLRACRGALAFLERQGMKNFAHRYAHQVRSAIVRAEGRVA